MAITGLYTDIPVVGPFQSSGGDYYIFGRDASTATSLQAYKATDPNVSWSSIDVETGFTTEILNFRGKRVGDVVHLIIVEGESGATNYKYLTFDMGSDAFIISETIKTGLDTRSSSLYAKYGCSLQVRSGGEIVAAFNGQRKKLSGQGPWSRIHYSRRTGTDTWTVPIEVFDDVADLGPMATAIDDSDNVIISCFYTRVLTAANALENSSRIWDVPSEGFVFTNSSNQQQAAFFSGNYFSYFIVGDTGLATNVAIDTTATLLRGFVDSNATPQVLWTFYKNAANKIVAKSSTDDGATWSAATVVLEDSSNYTSLSLDSLIYSVGDDVKASRIYVDASAATGHKDHVVRSKKVNINLNAASGVGAVASVSKYLAKTVDSAVVMAAIADGEASTLIGLSKISTLSQQNSFTVEGASVDVALQSVSFAMSGASFGTALETEGGTTQLNLTRLGPGGYPIAALPGAPGGPSTSVGLFSTDSIPAVGIFSNYEFTIAFPSSASSATVSVPVWQNRKAIQAITVAARTQPFSIELQSGELSSVASAAAFNSLGSLAKANLLAVWTHGIADELVVEASVVLQASIATAAVAEFAPVAFTGTSVVLNSAASQAVALDIIPYNQIVLLESIASAAANIIRMEGDEAFNLATAAASGTVGDLLVAIVIPAAIKWLVCASIEIMPEVAGDLAINAELQATVIAAAALQGSPQIGPEVDGTLEIAPLVGGSPAMKEC